MTTPNQFDQSIFKKRRDRGFSLIELLIVVAIILVIAAIAIPQLLRARMAANEAGAAETVRSITTATIAYSSTWGNGFPPTLATLGGVGVTPICTQAILLDPVVTAAPFQKTGFTYSYTPEGVPVVPPAGCVAGTTSYLVTATPIAIGITGMRSFCSDETATIHYDLTGATSASEAACEALPALQ